MFKLVIALIVFLTSWTCGQDLNVLVSADGEGAALPCRTCPTDAGTGGLPQRATFITMQRKAGPVLVVDAGNSFFGGDSAASGGKVIAEAFDAMTYDAVNISYRDFRLGHPALQEVLRTAWFNPISANLLDEKTGQLMFKPYVVKNRIAIIGLTDAPAGLEFMPHLKEQLAGVRIRPSAEALAEHLPKAKAEADKVILLYYGTASGLRAIHRKFGPQLLMIGVGGMRPDQTPENATPPIAAAMDQGKSLGRVILSDPPAVSQEAISASFPQDPTMRQVLAAGKVPVGVEDGPTRAAVPRVRARQPHPPKGLAGVGLTEEQVHKAVERGAAFVWKVTQEQAQANKGEFGGTYEGYHTLAALALVKSGLHKVDPEFNRRVRSYLTKVVPETIGTYAAGTLCMLVEAYGDPQFEPVQRRAARYLFEGHTDKGWDYTPKVPEGALLDEKTRKALQVWGGRKALGSGEAEHWKRATTQPATMPNEGDNSLAQYAVMGLQAAARAGVEVPADTWRQVLDLYSKRQAVDGGWGYIGSTSATSGSMTCAGTYGITVARFNLGEKEPGVDEQVETGLGWLAQRFAVDKNPHGAYHFYYLYSVERLGRTLDTEFIGPHEWYPLGAKYLVTTQQPDGSWKEGETDGHPELTTSFALLFLAKSTPHLKPPEVKADGPGTLRTGLLQPPSPRVYFVLDCSGSMMSEMKGKPKFDLARGAISQLLAELPEGTMVALRAYGHRKSALDEGASEDTELLVQLAPMDRQALAEKLKALRSRGKTPLARSLRETISDHAGGGGDEPIDVILLTDGGEDTLPRQDPVAAAEELGKIKGVSLHIVGFDIGREDWGTQLRAMAAKARGRYWPAQDAATLLGELRAAVLRSPGTFEVLDGSGAVVLRGTFGDTKPLPPGQYTFVTQFSGQTFKESIGINPGLPTAVLFDAGRFNVSAAAAAEQPAPAPAPAPAPVAAPSPVPARAPVPAPAPPPAPASAGGKFCTHCGQKLAGSQKFCSGCGQKLTP